METKYKVVNGTSYYNETSENVVNVLERCRMNNVRIVLDYGDVSTGQSWGERYDICGSIGRSTGINKIPILIKTKRSIGGCGILDRCIIKISTSKGKEVLYSHPNYKPAIQ